MKWNPLKGKTKTPEKTTIQFADESITGSLLQQDGSFSGTQDEQEVTEPDVFIVVE